MFTACLMCLGHNDYTSQPRTCLTRVARHAGPTHARAVAARASVGAVWHAPAASGDDLRRRAVDVGLGSTVGRRQTHRAAGARELDAAGEWEVTPAWVSRPRLLSRLRLLSRPRLLSRLR